VQYLCWRLWALATALTTQMRVDAEIATPPLEGIEEFGYFGRACRARSHVLYGDFCASLQPWWVIAEFLSNKPSRSGTANGARTSEHIALLALISCNTEPTAVLLASTLSPRTQQHKKPR
jgi:hypothetical protein